ncbi:MAG: hypothetical protein QOJ94_1722 [Sphingomonadales bacterium]|jgi:hypothetical protein|nr:hypothetical protein [Sphingomonadales bacterium]
MGLEYLLKEDAIGNEPPTNAAVQWNTKQPVRYLVLLPRNSRKLFRFRIYDRIEGGLYIESDFSYKNPYQR